MIIMMMLIIIIIDDDTMMESDGDKSAYQVRQQLSPPKSTS